MRIFTSPGIGISGVPLPQTPFRVRTISDPQRLTGAPPWISPDSAVIPPPPVGGNLVHNQAFTVTGSGFGTKTGTAPDLWDDCQGSVLLRASGGKYDRGWHYNSANGSTDSDFPASDANFREFYRDPTNYPAGNGVAGPHPNITTKVLCGAHDQGGGSQNSSDVYVSRDYTIPGSPWWRVLTYYFRVNPNWFFVTGPPPDGDCNFKQHFAAPGGKFAAFDADYFYIEYGNSEWTGPTVTGEKMDLDNPGGTFGTNPGFVDSLFNQPANPCQGWHKVECVIHYSTSIGGGLWKWRVNQTQMANEVLKTHDASKEAGGIWQETIGGFSRPRASTNVRYWADIYADAQASNPGRFYLTDSATWGSETNYEIQRWSGTWTNTSVPLVCNKGRLSSGTVHLHYRNEVLGDQYLGTKTMT